MPITPKKATVGTRHLRSVWNTDVFELFGGKRKVPLRSLAVFCREAAFLFGAGLHIKDAMPILAKRADTRFIPVSDLHTLILQGESFSHALAETGAFPAFMCGYIAIGERTTNLHGVCERLADYFEARAATRDEIIAATAYPCMVFVMMLGVAAFAVGFVLPGYARIFAASDVNLPTTTRFLLSVSGFVLENALAVFLLIFAAVFLVAAFLRSERGRLVRALFSLHVFVFRGNVNCNISRGLAILLCEGVSVSESLPLCAEISDNPVVRKDLVRLAAAVNAGVSFSEALGELPYIDPLMISLAIIGERANALPKTMQKCNAYLEDAYRREIKRVNKFIAPFMTAVIGVILAAVMLAVILPTFELATAI